MFKKILLVIFILAFVVRLWGVYPGFPNYHPDEPQIYSRALLILQNREEDLGYWGYPALIPIVNAFSYFLFFIPITLITKTLENPSMWKDFVNVAQFFQRHVYGIQEINVLYWGRTVNAILGGGTVILVYLLTKKYFNKLTGLLAALFLTFNFRHVLGSHFALPDVPNGLFLLFPLVFSLNILNEKKTKDYIWGGITSGLSMSVKLSPFSLLPLLTSHLLSDKKIISKQSLFKILILLSFFVITVVVINIFHLYHLEALSHDLDKLNKRYLVGTFEILLYPYSYLYSQGIGQLLSILSLVGIVLGLVRYFKKTLILLTPIIFMFFGLTFYSIGGVYVRNFIAIIPLLLIFSALGISWIFKKNWILGLLLLLFSVFNPIKNVVSLGIAYSQPWNIERTKSYFLGKFENKKVSASSWFAAYLKDPGVTFLNWDYNSTFNLSELISEQVEYAVIDTDVFEAMTSWWMTIRGFNAPLKPPSNALYETFPIASAKELLGYTVSDFQKPPHIPETNFFIVKIPQDNQFIGQVIFEEDFDKEVDWKLNVPDGKEIPNTLQIFDTNCGGCIKIGQITANKSQDKYLLSEGLSRNFSVRSEIFELESLNEYKVSVDVWNDKEISKNIRDGFMKVELYRNKEDAELGKPGDLVFVSERYFKEKEARKNIQKVFPVPEGYKFVTISFQVDRNRNGDFYFDNLKLEKSVTKMTKNIEFKEFPENIFFEDSIL